MAVIFTIPPLKKGGEGGFEKANKDYKISPDPSLPKRGIKGQLC